MRVVTSLPFVDSSNRVKHSFVSMRRAEWLWWQREYLTLSEVSL